MRSVLLLICALLYVQNVASFEPGWSSYSSLRPRIDESAATVFPEAVGRLQELWVAFKQEFNKNYQSVVEELKRFYIFSQNYLRSVEHNMLYERNQTSYMIGINKFSDWTAEEYRTLNGLMPHLKDTCSANRQVHKLTAVRIPDSMDWRRSGAVTPVKDQGMCGSCYSFSATGALEGQHFLRHRSLVDLAEQQVVDCSGKYGNMGCNGGLPESTFTYWKENTGADVESSYPYVSGETGRANDFCKFKPHDVGATVTGHVEVTPGDEDALKHAVATVGPISVAIDASLPSFQSYHSGIYDDPQCGNTMSHLDHAVLVVGYGTENGRDYWLVKNSWATTWGDEGYIKMRRNHNNTCGIALLATYPLV